MRNNVARIATFAAIAGIAVMGCTVKVSTGKKPKPPPPPPPAAKPEPKPAAKRPMLKMKFKVSDDGKVELPGPVLFQTGSDKLLPESDAVLTHVQKYLEQNPQVTLLRIEGHTDTDGQDAANLDLSKRRAMSVARWLTAKGIDCKRLMPVGFGENKLIVNPEKTPDDKATNRRVAFVNAHIKGKPIAGYPADGGAPAIAGDPCQ